MDFNSRESYIFLNVELFAYYQIENLVCSMLIAYSYNNPIKKILKWVEKIKEPPGRLEKITYKKKEYTNLY